MTPLFIEAEHAVIELDLLPGNMHTNAASAMLIAIALQESRLTHRKQINGPARGFWQFENGGGVIGVMNHAQTKKIATDVCATLKIPFVQKTIHEAIAWNDALAYCFARLLLYTEPASLPRQDQPDEAWRQYMNTWRPGMPHRETWNAFYAQAWSAVLS